MRNRTPPVLPTKFKMQPALLKNSWTLTNTPPLWPLEFFTVALNEKMSTLIADCDAGKFGHVWNISVNPAEPKRRQERRIFYRDALAVLNQNPFEKLTYEECLAEFIPATRGLKGTELQKFFCCGPDLIHDLDAAGLLEVERERLAQKGPRASRLYSRDSVIRFLTNRALVRDPKLN